MGGGCKVLDAWELRGMKGAGVNTASIEWCTWGGCMHAHRRPCLSCTLPPPTSLPSHSIVTIHNNPENLAVAAGTSRLAIQLADVTTADPAPWFDPVADFIAGARAGGGAVLVHCGAGVSRSATLVIAHLMRSRGWSAERALAHVTAARSVAAPNDGFWRALCALESRLGLAQRSDPDKFAGSRGADAGDEPAAAPARGAGSGVGGGTRATFVPAGSPPKGGGDLRYRCGRAEERRGGGERRDRSRDRRNGSRSPRSRRSRSPRSRRSWSPKSGRSRSRSREGRGSGRRREQGRREESPDARHPAHEPVVDPALGPSLSILLTVLRDDETLGTLTVDLPAPGQVCTFGRMPSCDVPLEHPSISRAHAQITLEGGSRAMLTDLGSGRHAEGGRHFCEDLLGLPSMQARSSIQTGRGITLHPTRYMGSSLQPCITQAPSSPHHPMQRTAQTSLGCGYAPRSLAGCRRAM